MSNKSRALAYDFPLRPDFLAQLVLPVNITEREAKKLGAFLLTLVQEQEEPETVPPDRLIEEPHTDEM